MNRRGFLGAILAAGAAPAIVRADSLMRVSGLIVPDGSLWLPTERGLWNIQSIVLQTLIERHNELRSALMLNGIIRAAD